MQKYPELTPHTPCPHQPAVHPNFKCTHESGTCSCSDHPTAVGNCKEFDHTDATKLRLSDDAECATSTPAPTPAPTEVVDCFCRDCNGNLNMNHNICGASFPGCDGAGSGPWQDGCYSTVPNRGCKCATRTQL